MYRVQHKWIHLLNFAIHAVVGIALFVVLGLPAVFLDLLTHWLAGTGVSGFTLAVLKFVADAMLVFDAVAVLVYIGVTTTREVRRMLDEKAA
jgi:hypothetical protein